MEILKKIQAKKTKKKSLSVCHWNFNSLPAQNFSKLTQLKAYISMYKHDLISPSDSLLEIDGYNLVRADYPNHTQKCEVCIYY